MSKRLRNEDEDIPCTPNKKTKFVAPETPNSLEFKRLLESGDEKEQISFQSPKFISCFPEGVDMDNVAAQLKDKGCFYSFNCTTGDGVKLFKFGYTENLPQRIKSLCSKFNLSNIKFEKLTTILGQSYERKVHKEVQKVKPCLNTVNNKSSTEIYSATPSKTVAKLSSKYSNILIEFGKATLVFSK